MHTRGVAAIIIILYRFREEIYGFFSNFYRSSAYDLLVFGAPVSAGLSSTADIGRIRDLCTFYKRFVEVPIYIYIYT
jgi:hypothetical protein